MIRRIIKRITIRKQAPEIRTPKRICVFKIGAIGDVLMSTPMLHALRQRFPNARIDYWTGTLSAAALADNEDINQVFAFDDTLFFKKRVGHALNLARQIASRKYDIMLNLDKHWSLGVFGRMTGIPVRIGFDREGEGFAHTVAVQYLPIKHEVDYYLELAYLIGAKRVAQPKLEMALSAADKKFAQQFFKQHNLDPKKTIAISAGGAKNPGQNMVIRRWPVGRFAEIARALAKEGWKILLVGKSPGDDHVLPAMLAAVPHAVNAIGNFSIKQSAALFQHARLLVCNDSGPMHIAAAVGTPTVSVFGPTDPHRKAPRGDSHKWIWHPIDCTQAEVFARYDEPHVLSNILKVKTEHVLKAIHQVIKK
jgi:lipopolysaccharide heptosyltransferase II